MSNKTIFRLIALVSILTISAANLHADFSNPGDHNGERSIVIITASYNNKEWYKANLDSIFNQEYQNYRVIYIDDCSTDGTADLVKQYIKECHQEHRVTLIENKQHMGAVANHFRAIHSCDDRAIICIVDGDDGLANNGVLSYLNSVYANPSIWLTYGQFIEYPTNSVGFCCPMPHYVVARNDFRGFSHIPSHMRTFYAGLYKQIKKEDLMYNGEFFEMNADIATMFPMIEMARDHFKFISEILYIYNGANVINDHKKSKAMQRELDLVIRSRARYEKVESPVLKEHKRLKIGLLVVATGKYIEFIKPLLESADTYFCTDHEITYFVFTDGEIPVTRNNIVKIHQEPLKWPFATMMRLAMYHNAHEQLQEMDYLFACDADMLFVDRIGNEILGDLVGTLHPGYVGNLGTYERNPHSTAYIPYNRGKCYFCGGFNGGRTQHYLDMVDAIADTIAKDLEHGIIALWHDESHINKYFVEHEPTLILSPSYCYVDAYRERWSSLFSPKLIALVKDHAAYQS